MALETAGISLAPGRRAPQAPSDIGEAPRSDVPSTLLGVIQRTWAEVLEVPHVEPDDDFFDLGGNSLIVASAVGLLGERVGLELPMRALLAAPTPAEMVEQIAELRARDDRRLVEGTTPFSPNWVLTLQAKGAQRPVFLFPGGRGSRWVLAKDAQIAAMVGRDHPFYGFQREQPHISPDRNDWIPAMAADYVTQIRTIQDRGPYLLYAVCSGGALAWEAARQLIDLGAEIAGMLFYEAPLAADFGERSSNQITPAQPVPGHVPPYVPEPLAIALTLLMTEAGQAKGRSAGWHRVARGQIDTVVMPGDTPGAHNLYFRREAMIAGHLRDWIVRTEARLRSV